MSNKRAWYQCTECGHSWYEFQQTAPPSTCVVCGERAVDEWEVKKINRKKDRNKRRTHVRPRSSYSDVIDFAADLGFDAVEFGEMDPEIVAQAFEDAATEVREE